MASKTCAVWGLGFTIVPKSDDRDKNAPIIKTLSEYLLWGGGV